MSDPHDIERAVERGIINAVEKIIMAIAVGYGIYLLLSGNTASWIIILSILALVALIFIFFKIVRLLRYLIGDLIVELIIMVLLTLGVAALLIIMLLIKQPNNPNWNWQGGVQAGIIVTGLAGLFYIGVIWKDKESEIIPGRIGTAFGIPRGSLSAKGKIYKIAMLAVAYLLWVALLFPILVNAV